MRERREDLATLGVRVAVVAFDRDALAGRYLTDTGLAWPLLLDPERALYRAYGMHRGRAWNILGPPAIRSYVVLLARGRRLRRPGSDVWQLGGDVLVDPGGTVRLHHVGAGPADRPSVEAILRAVQAGPSA